MHHRPGFFYEKLKNTSKSQTPVPCRGSMWVENRSAPTKSACRRYAMCMPVFADSTERRVYYKDVTATRLVAGIGVGAG
ncbi:hypothetical protein CYPRO_2850 [Cyclonatronum proteinivorum]|uniref:Uncharacterized protein n=1 Tax=Cyclonatronum proteinivorum TaxID=1457365 RepID=A0A345UNN6_9BACT|nr:hypothetical protein CYPRO_2850 [Cyclonatronum proteinivorum]